MGRSPWGRYWGDPLPHTARYSLSSFGRTNVFLRLTFCFLSCCPPCLLCSGPLLDRHDCHGLLPAEVALTMMSSGTMPTASTFNG